MKVAQKKWENLRDYVKSLARKQKEQRPTSGGASVDTEPKYKYWKNLKFLLDVDRPVRETVLSSLSSNSPVGYIMLRYYVYGWHSLYAI